MPRAPQLVPHVTWPVIHFSCIYLIPVAPTSREINTYVNSGIQRTDGSCPKQMPEVEPNSLHSLPSAATTGDISFSQTIK